MKFEIYLGEIEEKFLDIWINEHEDEEENFLSYQIDFLYFSRRKVRIKPIDFQFRVSTKFLS
jgi:hypothetical protein